MSHTRRAMHVKKGDDSLKSETFRGGSAFREFIFDDMYAISPHSKAGMSLHNPSEGFDELSVA
jgi:hypothetical protein